MPGKLSPSPEPAMRRTERWIVRHCGNAHPHYCDYFAREYGFLDLCRLPVDAGSKSKVAHFKDLILDLFYVLGNLRRIRNARIILAIGVMAVNIALLLRLGLLRSCKRLYWFGLFVHSPRWLRLARLELRVLDSRRIQYVLFSNFEKGLYADRLSLSPDRIRYVPYGDLSDWKERSEADAYRHASIDPQGFFFSGGDSNRDYPSLVSIFRTLPYKLVLVCSAQYAEIDESDMPTNIKVLRDVPSDSFDAYVQASKACIIPIAHDTGAAGQSCLLRYMKYKKVIIATDSGIIREYITNGVSGILVKDNHDAMATAIRAVNENFDNYGRYAEAAYMRYKGSFCGAAIARRIDEMMMEEGIGCSV
jgi:glycosyltransferase involved in cell wall biosynthesis